MPRGVYQHTTEQAAKMVETRHRNGSYVQPRGSASPSWEGGVSLISVHKWLKRCFKKRGVCEQCGHEGYTDWANISGQYYRRRSDFKELCRSCHTNFDRGHKTLTEADVKKIRKRHANGAFGYKLAEEFGVSPMTISRIVNRIGRWA